MIYSRILSARGSRVLMTMAMAITSCSQQQQSRNRSRHRTHTGSDTQPASSQGGKAPSLGVGKSQPAARSAAPPPSRQTAAPGSRHAPSPHAVLAILAMVTSPKHWGSARRVPFTALTPVASSTGALGRCAQQLAQPACVGGVNAI
jgi:hypothetical protein